MLPALEGSEKQIRWATSIREDRIATWEKSDPVAFQALKIMQQSKASWWIANRENNLSNGVLSTGISVESSRCLPPSSSTEKKTYELSEDGRYTRYVGELRDVTTGELVVDSDCPF